MRQRLRCGSKSCRRRKRAKENPKKPEKATRARRGREGMAGQGDGKPESLGLLLDNVAFDPFDPWPCWLDYIVRGVPGVLCCGPGRIRTYLAQLLNAGTAKWDRPVPTASSVPASLSLIVRSKWRQAHCIVEDTRGQALTRQRQSPQRMSYAAHTPGSFSSSLFFLRGTCTALINARQVALRSESPGIARLISSRLGLAPNFPLFVTWPDFLTTPDPFQTPLAYCEVVVHQTARS